MIEFLPGPLVSQLAKRSPIVERQPMIINRDLERYYALIERELASVSLTAVEWNVLRDALNGTLVEAWWTAEVFAAEIADALTSELAIKWGLSSQEQDALVERLRALSPGQTFAIVDAVERWWLQQT